MTSIDTEGEFISKAGEFSVLGFFIVSDSLIMGQGIFGVIELTGHGASELLVSGGDNYP